MLTPVLGGVKNVALSISSHEKTQLKQSLLFSYIVGSLYFVTYKDLFSRLLRRWQVYVGLP